MVRAGSGGQTVGRLRRLQVLLGVLCWGQGRGVHRALVGPRQGYQHWRWLQAGFLAAASPGGQRRVGGTGAHLRASPAELSVDLTQPTTPPSRGFHLGPQTCRDLTEVSLPASSPLWASVACPTSPGPERALGTRGLNSERRPADQDTAGHPFQCRVPLRFF